MELSEILSLITSVKMGGETRLLGNFSSMEAYNLLEFIKHGVAYWHTSSIFGLKLSPKGGALILSLVPMGILVPALSLEAGVEYLLIPM